ncbi:hypothetical protein tpqmel_0641 [Candidatus Gastranaerophilus sp. (ex Termes propinquus)]|nr:hypothetical protein tpqmel_0641 [Candidatus Gastranaerophilus sp. (ex Termes propinquus)]
MPSTKNIVKKKTLGATAVSGRKNAPIASPYIINVLCFDWSAKKPNKGCSADESKCPMLKIMLIRAKLMPSLVAMNGYKGTRADAYISIMKCPKLMLTIAFLFASTILF